MFYVIDKERGFVASQHETKGLCNEYIRNCQLIWGHQEDRYTIAEGAKARNAELKKLKR